MLMDFTSEKLLGTLPMLLAPSLHQVAQVNLVSRETAVSVAPILTRATTIPKRPATMELVTLIVSGAPIRTLAITMRQQPKTMARVWPMTTAVFVGVTTPLALDAPIPLPATMTKLLRLTTVHVFRATTAVCVAATTQPAVVAPIPMHATTTKPQSSTMGLVCCQTLWMVAPRLAISL